MEIDLSINDCKKKYMQKIYLTIYNAAPNFSNSDIIMYFHGLALFLNVRGIVSWILKKN